MDTFCYIGTYIHKIIKNIFNLSERNNGYVIIPSPPISPTNLHKITSFSLKNNWRCEICQSLNTEQNINCIECDINPQIVTYMQNLIQNLEEKCESEKCESEKCESEKCESEKCESEKNEFDDWEYLN